MSGSPHGVFGGTYEDVLIQPDTGLSAAATCRACWASGLAIVATPTTAATALAPNNCLIIGKLPLREPILRLLLLPGIPGAEDLPGDPRGVGAGDRLELLNPPRKAVGEIQVAKLVGRHPVRASKPAGLPSRRAPAVQEVPLLIELEHAAGTRLSHPDVPVLIDEVIDGQRLLAGGPVRRAKGPHVQERAVFVEDLHPLVTCAPIDDEHLAIGADGHAMDRVEFVRPRVLRILRRAAPVHDEFVVRSVLGHASPAVAVADEVGAVRQPGDVGRPVECIGSASTHTQLSHAVHELTVVGKPVNHVQLVVDDPDVLLLVVGADLDLMRAAAAWLLGKHLVEVRPLVHEIALAVDDEDRVLPAPLPPALRFGLARGAQPV